MRARILCLVPVFAILAAPGVRAQDATAFVFATYHRCNEATEDRADAIFKDVVAPVLKAEVAAGHIAAYGWAKHWAGGDWRRLQYITGTSLDAIVDARKSVLDKLLAEHKKEMDELGSICSGHDDYLWSSVAASGPASAVGQTRSAVAMSTYFQCDSREKEADAIVNTAFAPVMNQHVKDGKIARWAWLQHRIGGKYRRLLVVDGPDYKSMLKYWNVLSPALEAAQPELAQRFSEICGSHTDYVWDISGS